MVWPVRVASFCMPAAGEGRMYDKEASLWKFWKRTCAALRRKGFAGLCLPFA